MAITITSTDGIAYANSRKSACTTVECETVTRMKPCEAVSMHPIHVVNSIPAITSNGVVRVKVK